MRIIVDIMSGDKAPLETLKGVCLAAEQKYARGVHFTLVGDSERITALAEENHLHIADFSLVHTEGILTMEDDPMSVTKEKKDSSMAEGLRRLAAGEGDAFVSAGNTGALFTGATLIVKRTPGIGRAGIGAILPLSKPFMLIDSGASVRPNEDYMNGFALMGSAYMKAIYGVESPAVGLVNNGTEEHKGTELHQAAYAKLRENKHINFIGNVEGGKLPLGICDVAVSDGFTGNVLLKTVEGMGKMFSGELKTIFKSGLGGALAYLLVRKKIKKFKKKVDAKEHGGAPILGLRRTVIKAHGSSDAKAFSNAIRQAIECCQRGVTEIIAAEAAKLAAEKAAEKTEA